MADKREIKENIDYKWDKYRKNKNELIKEIGRYTKLGVMCRDFERNIVDAISTSFSKNENMEKSDEVYLGIGRVLESMDKKSREIEDIKRAIENKEKEKIDLGNQIQNFQYVGNDYITIGDEKNKADCLRDKRESILGEIKRLQDDLRRKEEEMRVMELEYGQNKKKSNEQQNTESVELIQEESGLKFGEDSVPDAIQGYRFNVINNLLCVDRIRHRILKLLDEGVGIDDSLRDKIESEVNSGFYRYHNLESSSLGMKLGRHLKNKYVKLSFDKIGDIKDTGSRLVFPVKNGDKQLLMELGEEGWKQIGGEFDGEVIDVVEKGGVLYMKCKKGDKYVVMYLSKNKWVLIPGEYDGISKFSEIGGKITFLAKKGEKYLMFWGKFLCGGAFDEIGEINEINGKPVFWARIDKKYVLMCGKEQLGEYDEISKIGGEDGKLVFKVRNGRKRSIISITENGLEISKENLDDRGEENIEDQAKKLVNVDNEIKVGEIMEISGKMVKVELDGGEYVVKRGNEQLGGKYKEIGKIKEISGKPVFKARDDDGWFVMDGTERQEGSYEYIGEIHDYKGKVLYRVKEKSGLWDFILGGYPYREQERYISEFFEFGGEVFYFVKTYNQTLMYKGFGNYPCWRCSRGFGVLCEDGSDLGVCRFEDKLEDYSMKKIGGNYVFVAYAWGIDEWKDEKGELHYGETYDYDEVFCFDEKGNYEKICGGEEGNGKRCFFFRGVEKIGENLVFVLYVDDKQIVYLWSEQQGGEYDEILEMKELGGKLLLKCRIGDKIVVVWGGEQCGGKYDEISEIEEVEGKPMFKARRGDNWLVFLGKEQQGKEYDEILDVKVLNGKVIFKARIGDKIVVVWGGKQYGGKYDEIGEIREVNGEPAFSARRGDRWITFPFYGEENMREYEKTSVEESIGGKPIIKLKIGGKYIVMWGSEQMGGEYDEIIEIKDVRSKPIIRARSGGKEYLIMCRNDFYLLNKMKVESDGMVDIEESEGGKLIETVESFENEWLSRRVKIEEILGMLGGVNKESEQVIESIKREFDENYENAKLEVEGYEEAKKAMEDMNNLENEYEQNRVKIIETRNEVEDNLKNVELKMQKLISKGRNSGIFSYSSLSEDKSLVSKVRFFILNRRWDKLAKKQEEIKDVVGALYVEKRRIKEDMRRIMERYGKKGVKVDEKQMQLKTQKVEIDGNTEGMSLMLYVEKYGEMLKAYDVYIGALLEEVKGLDLGISGESKEILLELLENELIGKKEEYEGNELLKDIEKLKNYLDENEVPIKEDLRIRKKEIETLQQEIEEIRREREERVVEIGGGDDNVKNVKELVDLEGKKRKILVGLKSDYDKIKDELDRKLRRYRGEGIGDEFQLV